jgi:hypothetical protein
MKTLAIATTLALSLMASPWVLARPADEKSKAGDQSQSHHKTIQGFVAGVTVVGETMVDYQQTRAITAEADYLTIVAPFTTHGDQGGQQAKQGEHGPGDQASGSAEQDKDVKQTANAGHGAGRESRHSEGSSRQSARVYLIQVTPKTQVCECDDGGKKKCDLARLEVGDRVEVEYEPSDAAGAQSQDSRHGRHRVMWGKAISISILHGQTDQHQDSEKVGQSQGSESNSQDSKKDNKG